MTILGLDFDNTLVCYDQLFYQIALEKGLIEKTIPAKKVAIRDSLRSRDMEDEFTILQGEVYGLHIIRAEPAEGMLKALEEIHKRGIKMVLVSHKTKTPYKGPKYDLHKAAKSWLSENNLLGASSIINWTEKDLFFEETKVNKIKRINSCMCTHYVDDLQEILFELPSEVKKIHYNPDSIKNKKIDSDFQIMRSWSQLNQLVC